MSLILEALATHAAARPHAPAFIGRRGVVSYAELLEQVERTALSLKVRGVRVLALAIDNGPAWAVIDLAAQRARVTLVPLPHFFSDAQVRHVLESTGADALVSDRPGGGGESSGGEVMALVGEALLLRSLRRSPVPAIPPGCAKITFTSGTTGAPKGVCLAQAAMDGVARTLADAVSAEPGDRHLALLPLATLLENIAGVYAPLMAGAATQLLPLEAVGLSGSSGLDPARMADALHAHAATTAITVPALLQGLVAAVSAGAPAPGALRYLAVGGATVSGALLAQARGMGLPVYEGYGLSESASVVALNRPGEERPGSVGRPLEHLDVCCADDGEVLVRGSGFLGYLGDSSPRPEWWPTGDLGRLDDDGYLYLEGRKRNLFITAFGRNVAPEWVEAELTASPRLFQAAVFGEGRPWNAAVLFSPLADDQLAFAVEAANRRLPDYARVQRWVRAVEPFTPANGLATANGRVRREAVWQRYGDIVESLYETSQETTA